MLLIIRSIIIQNPYDCFETTQLRINFIKFRVPHYVKNTNIMASNSSSMYEFMIMKLFKGHKVAVIAAHKQ